jgi:hypothetical protein
MKQIYTFFAIIVLLSSCKKGLELNEDQYLNRVEASLKRSLSIQDYDHLDFTKAVFSKADSVQLYFLRIPFIGKMVQNDFVVVQTSKDGQVQKGRIVHLEGGQKRIGDEVTWNGTIEILSLNRKNILKSNVSGGYIEALHLENPGARLNSMMAPGELPEIIVVAYINSGISYSDWIWLESLFYQPFDYSSGGGGDYGGYYGSLDGSYSGEEGSYSNNPEPILGASTEPLILIDKDTYIYNPAIDIAKYLKCFDAIPDIGSTCSVEIFTDIPVDNDPTKLFNWNTESPGHVFLQFKKTNGLQHVLQNIGFYPSSNWKEVLNANPVDSKIVNDGAHEFNASLKMNITPYEFRDMLNRAKELASMKYDTDQFNCTDFALEIFNYVRTPLEIPRYSIPGGIGTYGTRTPQGLYVKLNQMKINGDVEASNISIGFQKAWVAKSDGPCN